MIEQLQAASLLRRAAISYNENLEAWWGRATINLKGYEVKIETGNCETLEQATTQLKEAITKAITDLNLEL